LLPEETLFERGTGDAVMGDDLGEHRGQCADAKRPSCRNGDTAFATHGHH